MTDFIARLTNPMIQDVKPFTVRKILSSLAAFATGFGCFALFSTFNSGGEQLLVDLSVADMAQLPMATRAAQFAQLAPPDMRPLAKFAITALQAENNCFNSRDTSMRAQLRDEFNHLDAKSQAKVLKVRAEVETRAQEMAGVTLPLGLWDPLGFSTDCSAGKLLYYREAELKHGRVGMVATLGMIVGEKFHPLFGGDIDVPSAFTGQQVAFRAFWSLMMIGIAFHEVPSALTYEGMDMNEGGLGGVSTEPELSPVAYPNGPGVSGTDAVFGGKGVFYTMRTNRVPGDFNFDPLGLKPKDAAEFKTLQTKEINNGRLAMLAAMGILAQELATGKKIF